MIGREKVILGGLGVAVLVIALLVLGFFGHWFVASLGVVVALGAAGATAAGWRQSRAEPPRRARDAWVVQSSSFDERPEEVRLDCPLPTQVPDVHLGFTATVAYRVTSADHSDPAAAARCAIRERAEAVSRHLLPTDIEGLQDRLADALGRTIGDPTRGIAAKASGISVTTPDDPRETDEQVARFQARRHRERSRADECDVRQYLSREVLKDTGSALVWWLARQDIRRGDIGSEEIVEAVGLIDRLDTLSAVARNQNAPLTTTRVLPLPPAESRPATARTDVDATANVVERLFPDEADADERLLFVNELARQADDFGRGDYARRLRDAFGLEDDVVSGETGVDEPDVTGQELLEQTDEYDKNASGTFSAEDVEPYHPDDPGPDEPDEPDDGTLAPVR